MADMDAELAKLLGAQNAQAQQALSSSLALADLLTAFRIRLIVGGFCPEDAVELARDYFAAMLAQLGTATPGDDA